MVDEKRRFSRVLFNVAASLTVDDTTYTVDHIANLSIGGCLFPLTQNLKVGTKCNVSIALDSGGEIKMEAGGKIVRCEDDMASVLFDTIDPNSLFHLQNIIRYNAENPEEIEEEIEKHPGIK